MKSKRQMVFFTAGIVFLCVLFCILTSSFIISRCEMAFYDRAAAVVSVFPKEASEVMKALKNLESMDTSAGRKLLAAYGYRGRLMSKGDTIRIVAVCTAFLACFTGMVAFGMVMWKRRESLRIAGLAQYLREVEEGVYPVLQRTGEDKFSYLEDEIYKTVAVLRESRETAVQSKENLAKNLADISHQLKTPLTGISLMGELLLNSLSDERQRQIVKNIISQNDRMVELVKSILTLSRLDAGVLPLDLRSTSAGELLSVALQNVELLIKEKNQTIIAQGSSDVTIVCDMGWTAEALGNLLKNCSEYGPYGSAITVTAEENPIFTQIIVEDEGPGLTPDDLTHLFNRFYKGKHAVKGSIGIGLSLARTIVQRQEGSLWAENRKKGGARFVMRFYKQNSHEKFKNNGF